MNKGTLKQKIKPLVLPLSLIFFVLISAAVTAISRYSLGTGQALASRYITVSLLFWIGLVTMVVITIYSSQALKKTAYTLVASNVLLVILAVSLAASNRSALFFGQHAGLIRDIKQCVSETVPTESCILKTYPGQAKARSDIKYLKTKHWAGF
jgi:predicted neutral ceramidase superfamily lipid hydrolase